MEVQVNVAADDGVRVEGTHNGHYWFGWTKEVDKDGKPTGPVWKHIRIPWNAKDDAKYEDSHIKFDVSRFEGIGMTGWNWKERKSVWVGYDFDSIINHKKGLSELELNEIKDAVRKVEWITIRTSTSGKGFHLYVFFANPPTTDNHNEHAALARAMLGIISARIGYPLEAKVDTCGGILWAWHRKKNAEHGLKLLKAGTPIDSIPLNWRDHISVVQRREHKCTFRGDQSIEQIIMKTKWRPLNQAHKNLLAYLNEKKKMWWWDHDRYMLVCHTADLKLAHTDLNLLGIFETEATGKLSGNDQNCFCFPMEVGWVVRRHHKGTTENKLWETDSSGWTRCYFDRPVDFGTACRFNLGSETASGSFMFPTYDKVIEVIKMLGIEFTVTPTLGGRVCELEEIKDNKILLKVAKNKGETWLDGYVPESKWWVKVLKKIELKGEIETPDEIIRHMVNNGEDDGWYFKSREDWIYEDKSHISLALASLGKTEKDIKNMLGNCVINYWQQVCEPFKDEYPGNRRWNKDAPQYSVIPRSGDYSTWNLIFNHLGKNLDEYVQADPWCRKSSIVTGADYLKAWCASMFQYPHEPLPYLFMYSNEQNSGKSSLHEALKLLFKGGMGVLDATTALKNDKGYNGELVNCVLAFVEELNLKVNREAYDRIKTWVTGKTISIHKKFGTPYDIPNTTHWIQCANNASYCPILPGDTRIVVIKVNPLAKEIPKDELMEMLKNEAPYMLDFFLSYDIPKTNSRLRIPVISSYEKSEQEDLSKDPVLIFMMKYTTEVEGHAESVQDLFDRFLTVMPKDQHPYWNMKRFSLMMPDFCVKGRYKGLIHVANRSFRPDALPLERLVRRGENLIRLSDAEKHDYEKIIKIQEERRNG